ncbi:Ni/Fe hydrogenase subunit alpha [Maritimibacter fusiformis]|uniref:Ni/Fe hydrogenase subunit alpha n=1 Tax=Maritimibacter fusiformis TaxID=2603819 RepID=A0A5D0RJD4_9RHOB|nr:Ni/Fe hydrogenase subunit alpha [Maritimibacter fusiformis]TYB81016.1 Ni/Fe hydrogenase subunit alpha [Maritimibacter fusiformis]
MTETTIKVDMLARVEGEGAFKVVVRDGRIVATEFRIFEPPRFFEAFLRGRDHSEAPDITARICGICPVAYQMSAVQAMEMALGVEVSQPARDLRRLLYCGEWIESHVLHAAMLHAPDFLGYASAIDMANDGHGDTVRLALELKKIGNSIVSAVGGREIHPINVKVGGWWKAPRKSDLMAVRDDLLRALDLAEAFVDFTAGLSFPDKERDYTLVSLKHETDYPMYEGRIVSNRGLDIGVEAFNAHFVENHVAHSNALQGRTAAGEAYLTGPVARYNLCHDQLSERARAAARRAGLDARCLNPYRSITIRAVEALFAVEEAIRLIEAYEEFDPACVDIVPRAGVGMGATEAPRGLLYHQYALAGDGSIETAQIVPPTAQNQPSIEADLESFIADVLDRPEEEIQLLCEQTIRNYDPCISCATHFLDLTIDRG